MSAGNNTHRCKFTAASNWSSVTSSCKDMHEGCFTLISAVVDIVFLVALITTTSLPYPWSVDFE